LRIRTALGFENSTPNNVIIAEAKVRLLKDRGGLLARNFLSKNLLYNEEKFTERLKELSRKENYARFRRPRLSNSVLVEVKN